MDTICLTCVRSNLDLEVFPGPVFTVDEQGIVCGANRHAAELFGYDDLQGIAVADLVPDQFRARHAGLVRQFFLHPEGRKMQSGQTFYAKKRDDTIIPIDIALSMLHDAGRARVLVTAVDLTEHKKQERELHYAKRAFQLLAGCRNVVLHAPDIVTLVEGVCTVAVDDGRYLVAWVGRKESDPKKTVLPIASAGAPEAMRDLQCRRVTWGDNELGSGPAGRSIRSGQSVVVNNIGSEPVALPWVKAMSAQGVRSAIAYPLRVEGEIFGAFMLGADQPDAFSEHEARLLLEVANELAFGIEALKGRAARAEAEEQLRRQAYSDALTGLRNRTSIVEFLEGACAKGARGALLCVDFAEFREINDIQGHSIGDALLQSVAHRFADCIGPSAIVARFSGAEFAVILPESDSLHAAMTAEYIVSTLSEPFRVNGQRFTLRARVGISFYSEDSRDPAELYAHAALANREAAATGASYAFYVREMNETLARRVEIARDLDRAIDALELQLHYQPKIDVITEELTGAEALLRWNHPKHGSLSMEEVIPIAEERGLMPKLGYWIVAEACRQLVTWREAGVALPGRLAINVSAKQLDVPEFVNQVVDIVGFAGCSPELVELEVTESALSSNQDRAFRVLHEMRDAGFSLAIDDFGKGYSSLAYLSGFPAEKLKIDKGFVNNMMDNPKDFTIVKTIIGMATTLGVKTIAEGVETIEQADMLRELGCGEAQGFLYGVPATAKQFAEKWFWSVI